MFNRRVKKASRGTGFSNKKGVILLIVLITILIVVILADIILRLSLSQYRFTSHYTSRVQAYYAAMAGISIALDKLKTGEAGGGWYYKGDGTAPANNTCPDSVPCTIAPSPSNATNIEEYDLPGSIRGRSVNIVFCQPGQHCMSSTHPACDPPSGSNFCIYSLANFTFSQ